MDGDSTNVTVLVGIGGVVLGFALSALYTYWRDRQRRIAEARASAYALIEEIDGLTTVTLTSKNEVRFPLDHIGPDGASRADRAKPQGRNRREAR